MMMNIVLLDKRETVTITVDQALPYDATRCTAEDVIQDLCVESIGEECSIRLVRNISTLQDGLAILTADKIPTVCVVNLDVGVGQDFLQALHLSQNKQISIHYPIVFFGKAETDPVLPTLPNEYVFVPVNMTPVFTDKEIFLPSAESAWHLFRAVKTAWTHATGVPSYTKKLTPDLSSLEGWEKEAYERECAKVENREYADDLYRCTSPRGCVSKRKVVSCEK